MSLAEYGYKHPSGWTAPSASLLPRPLSSRKGPWGVSALGRLPQGTDPMDMPVIAISHTPSQSALAAHFLRNACQWVKVVSQQAIVEVAAPMTVNQRGPESCLRRTSVPMPHCDSSRRSRPPNIPLGRLGLFDRRPRHNRSNHCHPERRRCDHD